jgi:hypothetical protein
MTGRGEPEVLGENSISIPLCPTRNMEHHITRNDGV